MNIENQIRKLYERPHNPDVIDRQKPCKICGKPIGVEAMVTGVQERYHARCYRAQWEKRNAVDDD